MIQFRGRCLAVALLLMACMGNLRAETLEQLSPVYAINGKEWRVIETEGYAILYTPPLADKAQELARTFEVLPPALQRTLSPERNHRYTIILEAESFTSNGYVRIFPRASLYYSLPFASAGSDWYDLLAIHEGRHMIQLDTVEQGPVRLLTILFGELGLLPLFASPAWILEGDAVAAETLFTSGGRGRDPAFTMQLKALALEDSKLSYQSAILGSYSRMTPNPYNLGYLLYTHLRSIYAPDSPDTILEGIASLPLPVLGARRGVRSVAEKDPRLIYREMLEEYGAFWRRQQELLPQDSYIPLTEPPGRDYTLHSHLELLEEGRFATATHTLSRGDEILIYSPSGAVERRIRARPETGLSAATEYLVWDEAVDEAKFERRRHRIVRYHVESGRREVVGRPGRYAYPALSPDGERIALLEWGRDFRGSVEIIRADSGEKLASLPLERGEFYSSFDWHPNGRELLFLSSGLGRNELGILDTESGERRILYRGEEELIRDPSFGGSGIIYSSTYTGVPALYRLAPGEEEPVQLFSGRLGSFSPRENSAGELLFVDHPGSEGSVIARLPAPASRPFAGLRVMREEFYRPLLPQEPPLRLPLEEEPREYPSRPYSVAAEATRLHSWALLPTRLDPIDQPTVGLSLRADSLFGTSAHQFSLEYDTNEESLKSAYSLSLRRYPPDLGLTIRQRQRSLNGEEYTELGTLLDISLPLGRSVGDRAWKLTPRISGGVEADLGLEEQDPRLPAEYGVEAAYTAGYGPRSLQPRWGAGSELAFRHEPWEAEAGELFAAGGRLYLPGLIFTHGIRLGGAYENRSRDDASRIPYLRGWEYRESEELAKVSADYLFPIGYPDLALGGLTLFKRIRGGVFAERSYDIQDSEAYSSLGAELNLDFNLLQIPAELSAGVRGTYRVERDEYSLELLIMGASF